MEKKLKKTKLVIVLSVTILVFFAASLLVNASYSVPNVKRVSLLVGGGAQSCYVAGDFQNFEQANVYGVATATMSNT